MQPQTKLALLIGTSALLFWHCHNYYKTVNGRTGGYASVTVDSLNKQARAFILRAGGEAFYMRNPVLNADRTAVSFTADTLPLEHRLHLKLGHRGNLQYKKSDLNEVYILNEVHLYTASMPAIKTGEMFSLPLAGVQKIEVIEKDKGRTTGSYVIGALGYTLGAFAVAGIIIAATKSSCPFVSAYDGKDFALQGEIYGGAIYPQLARHDYLPLKMAPLADGTLQLKITNELKEKQYTDFADLLVIGHDAATKILSDESGRLYSLASPQAPVAAILNNHRSVLPGLLKEDDNAVAYMDDTTTTDAGNNMVIKFNRKDNAKKAKLMLTLKNGYWLDLLYGELAKGFGSYYETYLKKQSKKPKEALQKWVDEQQLPLTVSLRTKGGWKKVTALATIGPLANRSVVVPIDLTDVDNDVEIGLSSGFLFWEIDYAGLDFSKDDAFVVKKLLPASATDETGKDVLPLLKNEDGLCLEQPQIGNATTITYKAPPLTDASKTQTFILHAKGWYQHVRNFTNSPDAAFLKQFLTPNAFPVYGKELYKQIQMESLRLMAAR